MKLINDELWFSHRESAVEAFGLLKLKKLEPKLKHTLHKKQIKKVEFMRKKDLSLNERVIARDAVTIIYPETQKWIVRLPADCLCVGSLGCSGIYSLCRSIRFSRF